MEKVIFKGDESDRFSRFAVILLKVFPLNTIMVQLEGREPLTSKYISVEGVLADALNHGYRRHVEIHEIDTNNKYWAAGTNATSSIATISITFILSKDQITTLIERSKQESWVTPTLSHRLGLNDDWCFVDDAPQNITLENAEKLVNMLVQIHDISLLRETALVLRSYSDLLSHYIRLRSRCELSILQIINQIKEIDEYQDAMIAIVELLGYVGTGRSISLLRNLLFEANHIHIKWAAVTALGRIPDDSVLDVLIDASSLFQIDQSSRIINERANVPDNEWVEAALLLCIARRIGFANISKQEQMETYFVSYFSSNNTVLHRYACLGLSQLNTINTTTIDTLLNMLEKTSNISDKGYYTIPLLPTFKTNPGNVSSKHDIWIDQRVSRVKKILSSISISMDLGNEPDKVWGLENLADLSLEIGDNSLSTKMHSILSSLFLDWRYSYYYALSLYEKAENVISNNGPYLTAVKYFRDSLKCIESVEDINGFALSIIEFRKTIIAARINLIELLYEWINTTNSNIISKLKVRLESQVINQYRQFVLNEDIEGVSKRELECLSDSISILSVVDQILSLHLMLFKCTSITDEIKNYTSEVYLNLNKLVQRKSFSKYHSNAITRMLSLLNAIKQEMERSNTFEQVLRLVHEMIEQINSISWTMPAQMCLFNGLGNGIIALAYNNNNENGSKEKPLLLRENSITIVLSIQLAVSTGAAIQTSVVCDTLNERKPLLGVVEGSAICSFEIPKTQFVINKTIPVIFHLEFSSNDVVQKSSHKLIYVRKVR